MSTKQPIWLVTGASSGFGLEIVLDAAASGALVIGTVRSRTRSADAVQKLEAAGAKVLELDTSKDAAAVKAVAKEAEAMYKRIDVLVNNAGYSLLGAVEDFGEEEAHTQVNTNIFGPLYLIQALLPGMRARKSGTIINVSSSAGVGGLPSCGLYSVTKFGLEGLSESLATEVAPFNIRVLIVEPGAFRTNFLAAFQPNASGLTPEYKGTPADETIKKFEASNGKQPGDPVKGAKAMVQVIRDGCTVNGERVFRLPLGKDCLVRIEGKVKSFEHDVGAARAIAESTDV